MVKRYDGKTAPLTVSLLANNVEEVSRLCSGSYAAAIATPEGLQPAWRGIVFALKMFALGSKYERIASGTNDSKTRATMFDVSQMYRSNGLYRLRGVAKFLADAASVAQFSPPTSVSAPISRFLASFGRNVSQLASSLVVRRVSKLTGEDCNEYDPRDGRSNCPTGDNAYDAGTLAGIVQWDFPLPSEFRRSLSDKLAWPRMRVAPSLDTPDWWKRYPQGKPRFDSDQFLNAKWEQMLNIVASVVVGKGKSIQDERFKPIRVALTQYDPSERSSIAGVDQGLADRLFTCYTHAWREGGLGPWADNDVGSTHALAGTSEQTFPWKSAIAMLVGAGLVVAIHLSSRRAS